MAENTIFKLFSLVYPIGFVLVVLGNRHFYGANIRFTIPVLNGQRIWELLRVWGLVILGNLIGGVLFTLFISLLAPHLNLFTHETMVK
jgi:formate/nitrite transporter FocA (FNT family)